MTARAGLWAVIPAAGTGARFGADRPKQYLPLAGRTVLEWALRPFIDRADVCGIVVVLSPSDLFWPQLAIPPDRIVTAQGGAQRCHSVVSGLRALDGRAQPSDWVLVHDAARPCLTDQDLDRLIVAGKSGGDGALLAVPAQDTLKRAQDERVMETLDRSAIWRALTPQMFRLGPLRDALDTAIAGGKVVTDECSAMELAGNRPQLVAGRGDNIKITHGEDLPMAAFILQNTGLAK